MTAVADMHFSDDWLALRESADHRARHAEPTRLAADWLAERVASSPPPGARLVDLGCGSGSNARYLAPRLPGAQQWQLVDHDPLLLESAHERCVGLKSTDGDSVQLVTRRATLVDTIARGFKGVDIVTASALFDLLTADEVDALATACVDAGCAALFALSVDGEIRFHDPAGNILEDDEDRFVFALYEAHQRRDKGAGTALGVDAPMTLRDAFERRGYRVVESRSPWRLGAGSLPLIEALMAGWQQALHEQAPEWRERIDRWHAARLTQLRQEETSLSVGHRDIVALPQGSAA